MKHLAIIMDGNRRWAKKQSLQPWFGHRQGAQAIQKTVEFYRNQYSGSVKLKQVILSGSGICLQNIDKYLSGKLKTETIICDPFENIKSAEDSQNNLFYPINKISLAPAVGAAMKGAEY